jgi:hypothetical protein
MRDLMGYLASSKKKHPNESIINKNRSNTFTVSTMIDNLKKEKPITNHYSIDPFKLLVSLHNDYLTLSKNFRV